VRSINNHSCYHKIQVQNGWLKILEHDDSTFFRQIGVPRSESLADVRFYHGNVDFPLLPRFDRGVCHAHADI